MKKFKKDYLAVVMIFAVAFLGCYVVSKAYAQSDVEEVLDVIVNVPGVFQVTLYPSALDFGDVLPGRQKDKASTAVVKTNYAEQWRLTIQADDNLSYGTVTDLYLDASTGALTVRTQGGTGTHHGGTAYQRVHLEVQATPAATRAGYTSTIDGTAETSNYPAGTPITFDYRMLIPSTQLPGLYSGVVTYTLTTTII